jgi:acyl-coenzyme A synthetase/AMP-(fatty) acid ligase
MLELKDGRYYFIGRRGGVINIGGQKVHPEEIEAVINRNSDVQMSVVHARESPITGAIVVADVVLTTEHAAAEKLRREILDAAAARWRATRCRRRSALCRRSRSRPQAR